MQIDPNKETIEFLRSTFEHILSYEVLETLKMDFEEGICVDLIEFTLKEGVSIQDLKFIGKMEILSILRSQGYKHICLAKYYEEKESKDMFKEFDLDLIPSKPTIISLDKLTSSYIGDNENLRKIIEVTKSKVGEIRNVSFQRSSYEKLDILSVLTEKQRDILIEAHKHGYYDYPKKINSKGLSNKVNLSTATLVEHLRKAEGRLLNEILTGYT